MAKKLSYTEALNELEKILSDLEKNDEFDMDKIAAKIKEAAKLISVCKNQLKVIDKDLNQIMEDIE